MRYYNILLWICYILAVVSLIVGIIAKLVPDFRVFALTPLAYIRFTGICLLFTVALSLTQISFILKKQ